MALRSRHFRRIHERLQFVRGFFPELQGVCVRVGLARSRHVLGKGSLDPEDPGIWIRPILADVFTITHELVHLLQARELVPGGERACDLYALARSPLVIDSAPTYLKVPKKIRDAEVMTTPVRNLLHHHARRAVAERSAGRRNYLKFFEKEVARDFLRGDFLSQKELVLSPR